jgi:hypothetical protein
MKVAHCVALTKDYIKQHQGHDPMCVACSCHAHTHTAAPPSVSSARLVVDSGGALARVAPEHGHTRSMPCHAVPHTFTRHMAMSMSIFSSGASIRVLAFVRAGSRNVVPMTSTRRQGRVVVAKFSDAMHAQSVS